MYNVTRFTNVNSGGTAVHVCVLACVRSCARARVGMFYFCKYNYRYKLLTSLFLYFYVQVYCIVDVDVCCFQYNIPHVAVYGFDTNQPSLPTLFYSVFVSVSVSMVFSTVFHSINSPDNSLLSHSVPPVLLLPYWSFQL